MEETRIPFRPVKCKESEMEGLERQEGYVYFTTDTQKIFCVDESKKFIPMGGNSGIYYGRRELTEDEKDSELEEIVFDMNKTDPADNDIEGDQIPNVNDLILNTPDGGFYRVIDVFGKIITGLRLAVSGTGTGGGGGSDGPSSGSKPLIALEHTSRVYFKADDTSNMKIYYHCTSLLDDGNNYISAVKYYFGNSVISFDEVRYDFNKTIEFDIYKHIKNFSYNGQNTLKIEVTDAYGNISKQVPVYFNVIELILTSDSDEISKVNKTTQDPYIYLCTPIGGSILNDLFIDVKISPLNNPNMVIYSEQKKIVDTNTSYDFSIRFDQLKDNEGNDIIQHGVYLLTAQFGGAVPNTDPARIISSNKIYAQIIVFDEADGSPLVATNFTDTSIMQYDQFTMKYMIVDEDSTLAQVPVTIKYGKQSSSESVTLGSISTWKQIFTTAGVYEISIVYGGSTEKIGTLTVDAYSGDIPIVDVSSAEFNLTALGKSNTQTDKDVWVSGQHAAQFENFLWGNENGWIEDSDGERALKITNGAKLSIPTYHPFAKNATENGLTIELDFKFSGVVDYAQPLIHCLSKYRIDENSEEIIQTGFHITGQKATLNSAYCKATTEVINGELDENGNINEQDMALQALTQYFNEDTRIHLTYVIPRLPGWDAVGNNFYFVYTYLNGVLSGIMKLNVDTANQTADSFKDYLNIPSHMVFDSTYGDIYLYNVRVYRRALDTRTIIKNYIADLTNVEKKMELYKDNNIFTADGKISLSAIEDIAYACRVPYVLFNGGNAIAKKFKDAFTFEEQYALPVTKEDFRLMSMKMYDVDQNGKTYLALDIPIEAKNQADAEDVASNFTELVSGTKYLPTRGVQVYGQGTSSMVYPVKNLRLKFVQKNDYPQVYPEACPTEIICFKTDYMDSSSSHNTCTGNLVYDMYKDLNLTTPPQQFKIDNQGKDGVVKFDLVTAIKGFPIICFYAPGDTTNYEYIGRYNFNLDKATPEPFGFIPQKVYTGETVVDSNGKDRKVVNVCGLKTETVNGKTVLPIDENGEEIERDIVQCWEVLNNDNDSPTKFLKLKEASPVTGNPYVTFEECLTTIVSGGKYGWMNYFEDRYPDAMVDGGKWILDPNSGKYDEYDNYEEDLENGLFRMAKWINSTATTEATNKTFDAPKYYQTMDKSWNRGKTYYTADGEPYNITVSEQVSIKDSGTIEGVFTNLNINQNTFISKVGQGNFDSYAFSYVDNWYLNGQLVSMSDYGIGYNGTPVEGNGLTVEYFETNNWSSSLYDEFTVDSDIYRLSKFKTEFTQYFDMDFSLFYYVLTLTLLMMDSRAKNMMLASWDQQIWYPIFYDMDTMLGVNNTGFNKFSFDTEDNPADKVFNGFDSVLWNNFKTCFTDQIAAFYADLRDHMTLEKLLTTYNENGADAWNEALSSMDAFYKYKRPFEEGYFDGKDMLQIKPGQISYLYAAQGKRSNHRSWWLKNRLSYLDSKFIPTTYGDEKPSTVSTISFRAYALPEQKSTAAAEACVVQTPPNHQFSIKALNNSYQSIFIGNIVYGPIYATAGQTITLGPSTTKHEVESWILNPHLISDLGDLSDKYIGSLNFPGIETRLTELKFGRSSRSHSIKVTTSEQLKNVTVQNDTFVNKIGAVPFEQQTFSYSGTSWKLNGVEVNLNDYGIRVYSVPSENDQIVISYQDKYSQYYNKLLSALNIGTSCPYLEKVNIARCTGLIDVSFTNCSRLQVVDAEGCNSLTNIDFPANSILQEIYLPDSLTSLTLRNQPYLSKIKFDNNARGLTKIVLEDVPNFNSYNIVKEVFSSTTLAKTFHLTNINWTIEDAQKATEIVDGHDKLTGIDILDVLSNPALAAGEKISDIKQSLIGNININIPDIYVNEYDIYKKYKTIFPNVNITYGDNIGELERAYTITFMESDEEDSPVFYQVKAPNDGSETLGWLTSRVGPNGSLLGTPSKNATDEKTFEFSGYWIDQNGKYYYTSDVTEPKQGSVALATFSGYTSDMVFHPEYNDSPNIYTVTFYNYDNKIIKQLYTSPSGIIEERDSWSVAYGQPYDGPMVNYWYRGDSATKPELKPNEKYEFRGWTTSNYSNVQVNNPEYINPETLIVTGDVILYPHHVKVDVHTVSDSERQYFQVKQGAIEIKPEYVPTLQGKITVPKMAGATSLSGNFIGDQTARANSKITHIYFETDSNITTINASACAYMTNLQVVELPSTITSIGTSFAGCSNLTTINLPEGLTSIGSRAFHGCVSLQLTSLPSTLTTLEGSAFQLCSKIELTSLPPKLTAIQSYTFSGCSKVNIQEFGTTALESIAANAFANAGNDTTEVYIYGSIKSIAANAFNGYGSDEWLDVYFTKSETDYDISASSMGFSGNCNVTYNYDPNSGSM